MAAWRGAQEWVSGIIKKHGNLDSVAVTRKEYEEKAQRYNAEEEKRWRQKLYLHQQQQMHLQVSTVFIYYNL